MAHVVCHPRDSSSGANGGGAIRRSANLQGREGLGYFIWRDGDTWKLRWTTFGSQHRFSGRVIVEGGQIASFKRIDVDEEQKVIRFNLRIDGQAKPAEVEGGKENFMPHENPVRARLKP